MASVDAHAVGALGAAAENVDVTVAARSRSLLPRSTLAKLTTALALTSISWWTVTHAFHPSEPKHTDSGVAQALIAPAARLSPRSDSPPSDETKSALSHQETSIDGRVVDASGAPLAAGIVIKRHEDNKVVAGTSGEDGTFHVGALKEGTYDVTAEAGPRRGSVDNVVLSRGGTYFTELRLHGLVKPLVGRVVDDLGLPLGSRSVAFRSPHAADVTAAVRVDGTFELPDGFPLGKTRVYVSRTEARVTEGDAQRLGVEDAIANAAWGLMTTVSTSPLEIVVPRTGQIFGEVIQFDADGQAKNAAPVAAKHVKVMRVEEIGGWFAEWPQLLAIAEDGTFTAPMPAGKYFRVNTDLSESFRMFFVR